MTTVSEDLATLAESTHRLMDTLESMRPEQVAEPSQLPGWTRGHVIAHLARNADALSNLLTGARFGERRSMYPSPEARERDIETGAKRPLDEQLDDLRSACGRFVEAVSLVPESGWDFLVAHRTGPDFAVRTVPHKRIKEVEYHHVDLGLGYRPKDWPEEFVADQLAELLTRYEKDDRFPALLLTDATSGAEHRIGGEGGAPERIAGAPAAIVAWLSGRSDGADLSVPPAALPPVPPML